MAGETKRSRGLLEKILSKAIMDQFITELRSLLEKTLAWSEEFRKGNRDYSFDIDDEIYQISTKYGKDFKQGDLNLVYNLLDFYFDAIKHGFKEIDKNYSILKAESDIRKILKGIKSDFSVNLQTDVKDRLIRI